VRWIETDLPVLKAIYELDGSRSIDGRDIAEKCGIAEPELTRALGHLWRADLIRAIDASDLSGEEFLVQGISPRGLEALGEWPSPEAVAVVLPDMIRDLAAGRDDPDERNLLERIAENVATGTLTALATRYFPGL
jgi:hypothetical protein